MFGTPASSEALTRDVSTSKPDEAAIEQLRSQMAKKP
jgi:hypothetical protein